jgi:hypothetical protein
MLFMSHCAFGFDIGGDKPSDCWLFGGALCGGDGDGGRFSDRFLGVPVEVVMLLFRVVEDEEALWPLDFASLVGDLILVSGRCVAVLEVGTGAAERIRLGEDMPACE